MKLILFAAVIFLASLVPAGPRRVGVVENIRGIPYPRSNDVITVTEELAHADIELIEPALGKQLELTVRYRPVSIGALAVGVREDSFWLSYGNRVNIYQTDSPGLPAEALAKAGVKEARVTIPLSDKFQDTDRSLDLMFFAQSDGEPLWELYGLEAKTTYAWPTYRHFRNYVGSIVKRERAL